MTEKTKDKAKKIFGLTFNEKKLEEKMTKNNYILGCSFVIVLFGINFVRFIMLLCDQWHYMNQKSISLFIGALAFVVLLIYPIIMILFFKKKIPPLAADIIFNAYVLAALFYDLQIGLEIKMMLGSYFPLYIIMIYIFLLSHLRPIISVFYYLIVAYVLSIIWINYNGFDSNTMQQIYLFSIYVISIIRYYMSDISIRNAIKVEEANEKLLILSLTDSLTQIPNRLAMKDDYKKFEGKKILVVFLDLDNFKSINDDYSHEDGNKVLQMFASHLKSKLGHDDLYRYGGDEFVIIRQCEVVSKDEILSLKEDIGTLHVDYLDHDIHCSMGYQYGLCTDEMEYENIIQKADYYLHEVKRNGKFSIHGSLDID